MMNRKLLSALLFGVISCSLQGQILNDTLPIGSVVVNGAKSEYAAGAKIRTLDKTELSMVNSGDLSTAIMRYTPIYVRSYASGLSTIKFRGTSSDHTAIMFDGINLNSLTLGQANLCDIPMFLFDEVDIQYGGASSLYGSDAIGGSIHLKSNPTWDKGVSAYLQQDIASFQSYFSGGKIRVGNGRFESSTKVFYLNNENNFPLEDPWSGETVRQKNAAVENYGLLQEFFYKTGQSNYISLKALHTNNWHEVQPNISSTVHGGDYAELFNRDTRITGSYRHSFTKDHSLNVNLSFIKDFQLYQYEDTISTRRATGNLEYERQLPWEGKINAGIKHAYIVPDVYAYEDGISEHRTDIFASYAQPLFQSTKVTLNLRESIVTGFSPEFSPAIGIQQIVWRKIDNFVKVTGMVSRSYKIPTFNDRFWVNAGNPDLNTEKGINFESGIEYHLSNTQPKLQLQANGYYSIVDEWIEWIPISGSNWHPLNDKKVNNQGVEIIANLKHPLSSLSTEYGISYSFNRTTVEEVHNERQQYKIGKQLIYTPKNTGLLYMDLSLDNWSLNTHATYTGARSFDYESSNQLSPYMLWDATIQYRFSIQQSDFTIHGQVNNILSTEYVNIKDHAMPGRNFRISIRYEI